MVQMPSCYEESKRNTQIIAETIAEFLLRSYDRTVCRKLDKAVAVRENSSCKRFPESSQIVTPLEGARIGVSRSIPRPESPV